MTKPVRTSVFSPFAAAFDRYFFAPTDSRSLNLFRFLYCGALAAVHLSQMSRVASLSKSYFAVYFPIPSFAWLGLGQLPLSVVRWCGVLLLIALLCATCGFLTRVALTLAWITFFFFYGTVLGFEKPNPNAISTFTPHYNNTVWFVLLILSASPQVAFWGIDGLRRRGWVWRTRAGACQSGFSVPVWPMRLIQLTLALAYFGSGYTKLKTSGVLWADGYTLQAYLLRAYLREDTWAGYWLAQYYWLCVALSVCTLALELTFIVVPFLGERRRLIWFYVMGGLGFHAMIHLTMKITHFLPFMGLTYLIFVEWPLVQQLLARLPARFSGWRGGSESVLAVDGAPQTGQTTTSAWQNLFARIFLVGLLSAFLLCIGRGIEMWPFSEYGIFRGRSRYSQVFVGRIRGVAGQQHFHWLEARDLGAGFQGWEDGTDFVRFSLSRTGRVFVRDPTGWDENFVNEGTRLLQDFAAHLPVSVRERFSSMEFVLRRVERNPAGWLVPTDQVVFAIAIPEKGRP